MARVRQYVHKGDLFAASREAERRMRRSLRKNPERLKYFERRGVVTPEGAAPFGEGFLYLPTLKSAPSLGPAPQGSPGEISVAFHRGSKLEQQDYAMATRFRVGKTPACALVLADGVSGSKALAKPAARKAVTAFTDKLKARIGKGLPKEKNERTKQIKAAIIAAAEHANFEMVRQVLFDRHGDGRFDAGDKKALRDRTGVKLPVGPLSVAETLSFSKSLDGEVSRLFEEEDRSAFATFAAGVVIGNDLYTFTSGDAVVYLYRPAEPEGERVIQLTDRDQEVVELYLRRDGRYKRALEVHQNVVTDCFGDVSDELGKLRCYPGQIREGDVVFVASDGLGPRSKTRGLNREKMEALLDSVEDEKIAQALVKGQLADLHAEYQDNVSVAAMTAIDPKRAARLAGPGARWSPILPSRVRRG